jgi:Uma2 family endonuclease
MTMSQANAAEGALDSSGEGMPSGPVTIEGNRYVRAPVGVFFPDAERVPETKRHLEQRTMLYQILKLAFAERAAIGCDQFVYWDPTDPQACLAPDAFVRSGVRDDLFRSWKVWERGAPEVAVEIVSSVDERDRNWDSKLLKYRRLGVGELVRFDPESEPVSLRIWDAINGDLVEREAVGRCAESRHLPGFWLVVEDEEQGSLLRLSHDGEGRHLYPTPVEHARAEEGAARVAAEQRVRELEQELQRRRPR